MAKISGIELKAVKTFQGHDGVGLDANIYMDGKQIGHVFDDARGGAYRVTIDYNSREEFNKRVSAYLTCNNFFHPDTDTFVDRLLTVKDLEATYKRNAKKGYQWLVFMEYDDPDKDFDEWEDSKCIGTVSEEAAQKAIIKGNAFRTTVFRSLADFDIAQ